MPHQRQVIDYALARRSVLADLARGRVSTADVCDAHPDLLRAARYHGELMEAGCPVCRKVRLTSVTYGYGDDLQHASGRARSSRTLEALAARCGQVRIYVVEVCRSCGWNHLAVSYVIGTASAAPGSRERVSAAVPDVVPVTRRDGQSGQRRTARR